MQHARGHPEDTIDWDDVFPTVGREQLLSSFLPLVRDIPSFQQHTDPVPLDVVYSYDWEALEEGDKSRFTVAGENIVPLKNRATFELWQVGDKRREDNVKEVERLVREGAVVSWRDADHRMPALLSFTKRSYYFSLLACLESEENIDFTVTYRFNDRSDRRSGSPAGKTLLHSICDTFFPLDKATKVLEAVVRHTERHPLDVVDWEQLNYPWEEWWGERFHGLVPPMDFIHLAAENGRLSRFYPVVRDVPYFGDRVTPIELGKVVEADWAALSEEDKEAFMISSSVGV